jgi:hypothetical protein
MNRSIKRNWLTYYFCWYTKLRNRKSVPEFMDPVFAKTSPKRSFTVIIKEHVFAKTGSIISGTVWNIRLAFMSTNTDATNQPVELAKKKISKYSYCLLKYLI